MMTEEEVIILANTILMRSKFEREFKNCGHYIKTDVADAKLQVEDLIREVARVDFMAMELELSQTNAVVFKIAIDQEVLMVLTKPFHKLDDMELDEVVVTLYHKADLLFGGSVKIKNLEGINKGNYI